MPSPFHSVMHPLEIKPLDFLCLRAECQKLLITSEKFFSFPLLRVETHPRPIARLQEASDCVTTRSEPTAASSQMKGTMMMIIVLDEQFRNQTLLASGFLWFSWKIFQRLFENEKFFFAPLEKTRKLVWSQKRRRKNPVRCAYGGERSGISFHFESFKSAHPFSIIRASGSENDSVLTCHWCNVVWLDRINDERWWSERNFIKKLRVKSESLGGKARKIFFMAIFFVLWPNTQLSKDGKRRDERKFPHGVARGEKDSKEGKFVTSFSWKLSTEIVQLRIEKWMVRGAQRVESLKVQFWVWFQWEK
jgi:hypothetical protein